MITISADDPRSIKAIEIAAGASQWLKVRTIDGEIAVGLPSQCKHKTGRYYLVTAHTCDCEDVQRHGLSAPRIGQNGQHGMCKHILAVRLHNELAKAQQARPASRRRSHLAMSRRRPPSAMTTSSLASRWTKTMIREPQDLADELAAERSDADMLAHPETVVDAFDLFVDASIAAKEPAFDDCNRAQHYAMCGRYKPFERCPFGSHWHYVDDGFTAYR